jgi:predicted PurR-regulated permease PerM
MTAGPGPRDEAPRPDAPAGIDDAVPRSLRIAAAWSWRLIVVGAVVYALLWFVGHNMLLVAPLMIGLLLTGLLAPAMRWALKLRLRRSPAALLVVLAGLTVVGGTLYLVIDQFVRGLPDMVDSASEGAVQIQTWLQTGPLSLSDADLENLVDQIQDWINSNTQQLTQAGLAAVAGTVQFLTAIILTLVFTFFFLRDGRRIWNFFVRIAPAPARAPLAYAGDGAWQSLSGYVRATVLVALIDAIGIGLGLWILDLTVGMPFVLPLAALVLLGGFVPIVGAFISGGVAVVVALVSEPGLGGLIKALVVLGIVLLVQQLEGNVLQPLIVSRMVRIHPLAVIIAITAGILLAGIIGALVAVPIVAMLNTVVRRLHSYRPPPPALTEPPPMTAPPVS